MVSEGGVGVNSYQHYDNIVHSVDIDRVENNFVKSGDFYKISTHRTLYHRNLRKILSEALDALGMRKPPDRRLHRLR